MCKNTVIINRISNRLNIDIRSKAIGSHVRDQNLNRVMMFTNRKSEKNARRGKGQLELIWKFHLAVFIRTRIGPCEFSSSSVIRGLDIVLCDGRRKENDVTERINGDKAVF